MKEKIKEITENSEEQVIKTIGELVKIPSVRNEEDKAPGAPFGKDARKALNYVIELGKSFGMRTHIGEDGSYGYIEIGDESLKEMVGVIGHLDVVPPGDATQWEQN